MITDGPTVVSLAGDELTCAYAPDNERFAIFGRAEDGPSVVLHINVEQAKRIHHHFSKYLEYQNVR